MDRTHLVVERPLSGRLIPRPDTTERRPGRGIGRRPDRWTDQAASADTAAMLHLRLRAHNAFVQGTGDAIALAVSIFAAGLLRFWWFGEAVIPLWSWGLLPVWWTGAGMLRLLPSWGIGPVEELRRTVILLLSVFALTVVALFLSQEADQTSRLTLTCAFAISLFVVPFARFRLKGALCRVGQWGVPTVVYGAGDAGRHVVELLERERGLGFNPVGVFDDDPGTWGTRIGGVRVLGSAALVTPRAPVAILAMPQLGRARQIELLEGPLSHYRTVLIIPDLFEAPSLWVRPRDLNGLLGLEITSNLTSPLARLLKRTSDLAAVVLAAPLWLPLCAALAGLIWLEDRHNPFFLQKRIGHDGRVFRTWKFRTMVPNAEEVLRRRLAEDEVLRLEWETSYKLRHDPRITRVGSVLRRLSFDELPQLFNVVRGEMSLVGPRPLPAYHHGTLPDRVRALRERVRPGITGLWQVSGRSDIGTEGMEQWDPYYVRNWSLWLDAVVLIRTMRAVTHGSGAY